MSEYLHAEHLYLGTISQELEPHPLLAGGYRFHDDDTVVVTDWGDILPPVEFSRQQFLEVQRLAVDPNLFDLESVVALARSIAPRLTFDQETGCWLMPLRSEYDADGRAIYPQVTLKALGYQNQVAHRATIETFIGIPLPRGEGIENSVDNRCRIHACCNPYHLEVVSLAENNRRKEIARRRLRGATELFQLDPTVPITIGELALLVEAS